MIPVKVRRVPDYISDRDAREFDAFIADKPQLWRAITFYMRHRPSITTGIAYSVIEDAAAPRNLRAVRYYVKCEEALYEIIENG